MLACFYAASYVLLSEDSATDQSGKQNKTYVPVSFGSKIFTPTYLKLSIYAKEFLQCVLRLIPSPIFFGEAPNLCLS